MKIWTFKYLLCVCSFADDDLFYLKDPYISLKRVKYLLVAV